jgi:hypothetical protein
MTRSGNLNRFCYRSIHEGQLNIPLTFSVFETTIRYLGGLLSAYELSNCQNSILLSKAQEVAGTMSHAWVGVGPVATST